MINDSPDLINANGNSGAGSGIPLLVSAGNNSLRVAEFLLANGADVNRRDNEGTALHRAVDAGHKEMVELLIAHKADVEAKNFSTGATSLHLASQKGFKAIAEILLKNKADVNARNGQNQNGNTPLHLAAAAGHKAVAELLLSNGADVNVKDGSGATPLIDAIQGKNLEMAKFLVANKADVNAKSGGGETPLFSAISKKDLEMAKFLIANKADVNAIAKEGLTPLHTAVFGNELKLVELLLQNGADTEAKFQGSNNKGWTPLHFAANSSTIEQIAETLLESGANPNATNDAGETPLYLAIGRGAQNIAKGLLANKADPNIQTKTGDTPLGLAKRFNSPTREEIVALLLKYGANENLERLTRISARRAGKEIPIFIKGNQPLNRYTLIELVLRVGFNFPDLVSVKIDRLEEGGKKSRVIPVNLEEVLESGDCSKNLWLEWGDVVEIPELDHPVNESWFGYRKEYAETMQKCLERKVSISVKGVTTNLVLRAGIESFGPSRDGKPAPN
ncbi:MAG: ankyrin repeat domain-containing protein, partial [Verrucomicrobiota bacterium]